jgi:DNA-binding transcriptional ArsR family regulator
MTNHNFLNSEKGNKTNQYFPSPKETIRLAETFKTLSDPNRLRLVLCLINEELCVGDLAHITNMSISAVSHQLRLLKGMRLVTYRKEGKQVYYTLDDDHIKNLIQEAQRHLEET